jgi:CheY-like chemotaxis protein
MARGGFYSVDSLRGIYALLVDSNAEARVILSSILRYCGALVREVRTTDEALAALRETTPGVLVIAIRAPADTSWTLIRRLRALRPEDGGKIPAVGVGAATEADRARMSGFDGYLEEPIDPWALCRMVSELTG